MKNHSAHINKKDRAGKVGSVKVASKISSGWPRARQIRFLNNFSWLSPPQAKRFEYHSAPINKKDRAQKIGFLKVASKTGSSWNRPRNSWILNFLCCFSLLGANRFTKTQRSYKGNMTASKSWNKEMVVKSQIKLKPAALQLIFRYFQLFFPPRDQPVHKNTTIL